MVFEPVLPGARSGFQVQQRQFEQVLSRGGSAREKIWRTDWDNLLACEFKIIDALPVTCSKVDRRVELFAIEIEKAQPRS